VTRGRVLISGTEPRGNWLRRWAWLPVDAAIWFAGVYGATWLRFDFQSSPALWGAVLGFASAASLTYLAVGAVIGPYAIGRWRGRDEAGTFLAIAVLVAAALLLVWTLAAPQVVTASVPVVAGALALLAMFTARVLVGRWPGRQGAATGQGAQRAEAGLGSEPPLLGRRSVLTAMLAAAVVIAQGAVTAYRVRAATGAGTPTIASPVRSPRSSPGTQGQASVSSYGAVGDGVTDDTAAINTAIAANPGKVVLFPSGRTYLIRADAGAESDHGGGITLNQAGTVLSMYGATIRLKASNRAHYQMIDVSAPDCCVWGGRLVGDVVAHTGTTGEWGHGLSIGLGADRFAARDVYVTRCWGDGFFVWERPSAVSLTNCTGEDNRRQGLSIIDAIRPVVSGGAYINNGQTKYTSPGGGIDLEPDQGTSREIIDAVVTAVTLAGNRGPGLWSSSNGRPLSATINTCTATGNGAGGTDSGFLVDGAGNTTTFNSCQSNDNTLDGWTIGAMATNTRLNRCTAKFNTRDDILDSGTATSITGGSLRG
jgi:hypothetical protein